METVERTAVILGRYRYSLTRRWAEGPHVTWLMLNPSTADATTDDHTIRKTMGFAKRWGFSAIEVINLFPLRATNPKDLLRGSGFLMCAGCGRCRLELARAEPYRCYLCGEVARHWPVETDLEGPLFQTFTHQAMERATLLIAAWGCESIVRNKKLCDRPAKVLQYIRSFNPALPIECLGMSPTGNPYHPLTLSYDTPRRPFQETTYGPYGPEPIKQTI